MSVLGKETVKSFGEAIGHADVAEDVCSLIASDLEYRLRELTQEAAKFARQSKRRRVNPEDVNLALRMRNLEPLYGYASWSLMEGDESKFGFRRAGNSEAYYLPDKVLDLTSLVNAELPKVPVDVTLASHWLAIEGVQPDIPQNPPLVDKSKEDCGPVGVVSNMGPGASTLTALEAARTETGQGAAGTTAGVVQHPSSGAAAAAIAAAAAATPNVGPVVLKPIEKHELSMEQQLYYASITQGLLDNDQEYCKHAFQSLARDPGLHPLLPYFAQFVHQKVTESLGNLAVLTNMAKLESALLSNKNLFPELYLHQMLPPLLTCVVSKALTSDPSEDHWALRRLAAATVATVCHKFGDKYAVQARVTKTMINAVLKPDMAFVSQYGALVQLTALGPRVLDAVMVDNVKLFGEVLDKRKAVADELGKKEAGMVDEALFNACQTYVKWQQTETASLKSTLPTADVQRRYAEIREYFGGERVSAFM